MSERLVCTGQPGGDLRERQALGWEVAGQWFAGRMEGRGGLCPGPLEPCVLSPDGADLSVTSVRCEHGAPLSRSRVWVIGQFACAVCAAHSRSQRDMCEQSGPLLAVGPRVQATVAGGRVHSDCMAPAFPALPHLGEGESTGKH